MRTDAACRPEAPATGAIRFGSGPDHRPGTKGLATAFAAAGIRTATGLLLLLSAVGCRQDMHDQAKYEPLEVSTIFADGSSARPLPAGTVPRGKLEADRAFYTGFNPDGSWVEELPVELDRALLERGRERYEIYCTPCHDRTGSGRGMIVQRGFKQPSSYHDERLRQMPIGYFFDVITNGYATMSSYRALVKPHDRWAIATYIRVLQRSQNTAVDSLPEGERSQVAGDPGAAEPAAQTEAAAGGAA